MSIPNPSLPSGLALSTVGQSIGLILVVQVSGALLLSAGVSR